MDINSEYRVWEMVETILWVYRRGKDSIFSVFLCTDSLAVLQEIFIGESKGKVRCNRDKTDGI